MTTTDLVLATLRPMAAKRGRDPSTITPDTDLLVEMDLDSLEMLEIITAAEKHLSVELLAHIDLGQAGTPGKFAAQADAAAAKQRRG